MHVFECGVFVFLYVCGISGLNQDTKKFPIRTHLGFHIFPHFWYSVFACFVVHVFEGSNRCLLDFFMRLSIAVELPPQP